MFHTIRCNCFPEIVHQKHVLFESVTDRQTYRNWDEACLGFSVVQNEKICINNTMLRPFCSLSVSISYMLWRCSCLYIKLSGVLSACIYPYMLSILVKSREVHGNGCRDWIANLVKHVYCIYSLIMYVLLQLYVCLYKWLILFTIYCCYLRKL